ncbi:hypothetical protein QYE76_024156 [Lolium multiflorum]|uniref:Reverse transcriptase domain-containing protein n=1 Tax=Lolium multiflorum TaxID=4521 RepID=A0AAD8REK0_LOLMU|nr:hypothetical protein QYE76_024156 [Lolium multiflorum]
MLKCPIHELSGNIIIDNFYARLSFQDKTLLDTTCSGSFTRNKEEFKWDLLDRIQENAEDWENDKGKESGYVEKPTFKPLPPKEGNEEKEKKKKGTKKKKRGNKKKEVTAYPRVYEITIGNRKYVAPNDYYDNESEYNDLPMPFTYISDHDLEEHTTFDIENLWETNSENDDVNNCHSISTIHASSHNDIESSKLGDEVFENTFATDDYMFDISPSSNNDGMVTDEHTVEDNYSISYDDTMPPIFDNYYKECYDTEILVRKYSRNWTKSKPRGLFFHGASKTEEHTKWGHEVATPRGGAARGARAALWCGPPVWPPTLPFRLQIASVTKPQYREPRYGKPSRDAAAADPISGDPGDRLRHPAGEGESSPGGLYAAMVASGVMFHVGAGIPGVAPHYIPPPSTFNVLLGSSWTNIDPNNVPLASLVAQEEHVDVNFIKNNNFNNNAYRNNSSNNYRPYPYNNGNGYGNSYGNSYNNNRSSPPGLEAMLKEFISTQTAFNKSVEEKLGKIDILASKVDSLAADVDLLKSKVLPNENHHNKITTTANAIQVRINENIRLMAELRARWDREENEKLAKEKNIAKVWTITTTSNANATHVAAPSTHTNKRIGVSNVSTSNAKREKLPETAKTAETACDKAAEIFSNIGDDDPIALDYNGLNFDDCHISEVIKFLQKLAKSPNASAINLAFTHHITNALIKAREEKLEREASIPKKLEDGWEPIIKMKVKDFDCNALCDLGASISVMPKKIYNMLDLPPLKNCYLDVNLADHSTKKPLGKVDNVRITVNNNLVPVDFVVLDIECNASCPIILGRPFLRTVGATIDMKEGNIKYQFPLKKGMEHFPRKRMKVPFDSIMRTNYDVDTSSLDNT